MRYKKFLIQNYKAIKKATIELTDDGLVLLLGINESGKTSVLLAIESFDHTNDPTDENLKLKRYKQIRNKREITGVSEAKITAEIQMEKNDQKRIKETLLTDGFLDKDREREFQELLKIVGVIKICRKFVYQDAEFNQVVYELLDNGKKFLSLLKGEINEDAVCKSILKISPSVQYFEDFKDQIPEFISPVPGAQYYDLDWVNTLEGLFYHADPKLSISAFEAIKDDVARKTLERRVNNKLNKQFTQRWNKLKGVKTIHQADLIYLKTEQLFTFQIVGADRATVFSVDERSKGALWYFTFLLKTEFRKRKLRAQTGKTLYLIDEPGSNLHSSAQTNMREDFKTLASDSNVIYTTHNQYLIDTTNLSSTYITETSGGVIKATKYSQYLQGRSVKTSYFQPLLDAIKVQPFSLEIPWEKTLICEGIYDYIAYSIAFEDLLGKKLGFSIIPGEGASSLSPLISLSIAWGSKFLVLLDRDEEGVEQAERYSGNFKIFKDKILTLGDIAKLAKQNFEVEDLFSVRDKMKLATLAGVSLVKPPTKGSFDQILATIFLSQPLRRKVQDNLEKSTKKTFEGIYRHLNSLY
ncbi:MAG: hypothetical protein UX85_C0001G0162 [Candidatus Beckwithbacteria bacterium GW2011_GWB1_47_15]|uniref:Endonuclease GajA/Old nuclease/RecF-like AAA domain-containing protein n=1 Tax=Candidatus Beckwithbacteria bacterium GW2011_GWB1_47_15 TaxID=1618371 RepID=A0A0G1U6W1_9BACT|nr:MAG: hypothetical protein UY43_C0001G0964 [Candidatus Beckwithbacteria bacterium GW2011_GWC1_49_16]AQS30799.1 hypothetical protein [uncultured bacterium]KKU35984.1 MAG: hypothetical protein UX50_C0001G0161 [Candidatus Beckwithbacteria bacterium GW2011_GWA1_46_30]KKU61948.1 MAG: hypothetical protein UX85_C0001G0162 [Candidatus Beckwithbacteria bacterium GW2011_GWB1_47_15]KKU72498.1 MAG: hypothetical protein UX97_C0001G0368 [Candidatus Beckwithbacteria bacterium GW2011_GWA2_47_25]KKW04335.1 M